LEVYEFFKGGEFIGLDFLEGEETFSPPPGQLDGSDLFSGESIFFLVAFDLLSFFFFGGVVVGVDDEVVLAEHSRFGHVVVVDGLEVQVESHELCEGLLTQQSLCLHVDLPYGFAGQTFGVDYFAPFPHSEFLDCQLEDAHFLLLPTRRECVVPETLGLVVLYFFTAHPPIIYMISLRIPCFLIIIGVVGVIL
jgi:hypothetical protein